ncbi:hypothetical protein H5U35_03350, partial [Candidatus Aerophobetes bacterium]|nr:hypothetical protein [Candidatus Aerophobetes bacterium]
MRDKKVIVDTPLWVKFFTSPHSEEKKEVDRLLTSDRVAVVGVIIAELLQASERKEDCEQIKDKIRALSYFEASQEAWVEAGEVAFELRKEGIALPLTDILIATIAKK